MELRQFLPGGKGSNIIAGEQGVVYAVQMGSNDGGVRCFLQIISTSFKFIIKRPMGMVASQQLRTITSGW